MKIYFHFSQDKFLNSYLVANEKTGEAIFIDPLKLEMQSIRLLEKYRYTLTHILFTHGDKNLQREAALTVAKVYRNVKIIQYEFSNGKRDISEANLQLIRGDGTLDIAGMTVEYFSIAGLTTGAYCYKIDQVVFCGDTLIAGRMGATSSDYASQNLQKSLQEKIFSRNQQLLLFPIQGPPTSINVEKRYNEDLMSDFKKRRRIF